MYGVWGSRYRWRTRQNLWSSLSQGNTAVQIKTIVGAVSRGPCSIIFHREYKWCNPILAVHCSVLKRIPNLVFDLQPPVPVSTILVDNFVLITISLVDWLLKGFWANLRIKSRNYNKLSSNLLFRQLPAKYIIFNFANPANVLRLQQNFS